MVPTFAVDRRGRPVKSASLPAIAASMAIGVLGEGGALFGFGAGTISSSPAPRPSAEGLRLRAVNIGGEGGIRTLDTLASMPHFECGAFNRSATSPEARIRRFLEKTP